MSAEEEEYGRREGVLIIAAVIVCTAGLVFVFAQTGGLPTQQLMDSLAGDSQVPARITISECMSVCGFDGNCTTACLNDTNKSSTLSDLGSCEKVCRIVGYRNGVFVNTTTSLIEPDGWDSGSCAYDAHVGDNVSVFVTEVCTGRIYE